MTTLEFVTDYRNFMDEIVPNWREVWPKALGPDKPPASRLDVRVMTKDGVELDGTVWMRGGFEGEGLGMEEVVEIEAAGY